MRGSKSVAWRRTTAVLAALLVAARATPLCAAEVGELFSRVGDFVKSLPRGAADEQHGYADLVGAGRRDWAGVVTLDDPEIGDAERLVVLSQQADGSYRVAAQGPVLSVQGGTGHHSLDGVRIKQGSLFVSWSWNWHGCGGGSTQQIKFYKNQWRVIGAEARKGSATEAPDGSYDDGESISISHNLLTGAVVVRSTTPGGKPETTRSTIKPSTVLLDNDFGEDSGLVEEFFQVANC